MVGLLTAAFTVACIFVILSTLGFHRAIRKYCITNCKYFNGSLNMVVGEDKLLLELFGIYFVTAIIGFFFNQYLITFGILTVMLIIYCIAEDNYIYLLVTNKYRKNKL
jgi:hypothetical protein